jgi:hypothetical protein
MKYVNPIMENIAGTKEGKSKAMARGSNLI